MPHLAVHQALYGYRAGHELIASSTILSRESGWKALVMSDRPGGGAEDRTRSYLTGFPLSEDRLYALARTWHAEESPRPGSVWSHMLLIDFETLGRLPSLTFLNSLFTRPSSTTSHRDYSSPIKVDTSKGGDSSPLDTGVLRVLLPGLFPSREQEHATVVLAVTDFANVENTILSIWSEQWPDLRQNFSFTVGSGVFRRLPDSGPLDIQVVPASRIGLIGATTSDEFTLIDTREPHMAPSRWAQYMAEDLESSAPQELKDFLWRYAEDVTASRRSLRVLAEAFTLLKQSRVHVDSQLVKLLGAEFADPSEALRLKLAILGPPEGREREELVNFDELDVLSALLRAEDIPGVDPRALEVTQRVVRLATDESNEMLGLLRIPFVYGATFSAVVEGLAEGLEDDIAIQVVTEHQELATQFARRRPNLLTISDFWNLGHEEKLTLVDFVGELGDTQLARSVVNRHTGNLAAHARSVVGIEVITEAVDQLMSGSDLGKLWTDFLLSRPEELIDEVLRSKGAHADEIIDLLLSAVKGVSIDYLSGVDLERWISFWAVQTPQFRRAGVIELLNRASSGGELALDRLVTAMAPVLSAGPGDGELAALYARRYLEDGWDPSRFLQLFGTEQQLRGALQDLKHRPGGRDTIRRLRRYAWAYPKGWRRDVARGARRGPGWSDR